MGTQEDAEQLVEAGLDRVPDAAKFLAFSPSQMYALMDAGTLPYVKVGKSRRIPRRALIEFAARHLVGGR